jgi:hypothetical protein
MITTHGHIVLADQTNVELSTRNEYEDAHQSSWTDSRTGISRSPGDKATVLPGSRLVAEFLQQARQRPSSCSLRMVELLGRDGIN